MILVLLKWLHSRELSMVYVSSLGCVNAPGQFLYWLYVVVISNSVHQHRIHKLGKSCYALIIYLTTCRGDWGWLGQVLVGTVSLSAKRVAIWRHWWCFRRARDHDFHWCYTNYWRTFCEWNIAKINFLTTKVDSCLRALIWAGKLVTSFTERACLY